MPLKISPRFAALFIVIFFSCSRNPKNMVSFVKNFTDVIQTHQNLIFTFSHDMVNSDELGKWDSAEYIKISPKVPGRFRWSSTKELIFSPAVGFNPSTKYSAEFTGSVLKQAKDEKLYLGKEYKKLDFHTEYLQPTDVNAFWAKGKGGNGVVIRVGLTFNYDVDPAQVKDHVKIDIGGKHVSFTVDNTSPAKEIFVTVNGNPFGKDQSLINVKFLEGIKISGGNYATDGEFELAQVLAPRTDLEILTVQSGFKDNQGFVRVVTSQELEAADIEKAYEFDPKVTTKAELTENGMYITGEFFINQGYQLTLLKEYLKGVLGGRLKSNETQDVYFGEIPPSITFTDKKAIYLSRSGARNIGVSIVNVPEVTVRIYKIYENNILAYMRGNNYGYYYDDYYYEDYYGGNGPSYNLDYGGNYSSLVLERKIKTTDLPRVNGITALNLDIPKIDDFKGIYLVQIASENDYYLNATKLVSVSDIGIITKQSQNDLFIFTNSILSAEPLSDVDLHVISSNNQDVIQVKTDSKGVAIVKDFETRLSHFKPGMITARMGEDFNYLLLNQTAVSTSRFEVGGKHEHNSGLDVYIYGDRNIYRPGEKVNFNTIVRNYKWETMADVPLKIKIVMPNGREYASFRKNTNSQGAVDGSFDIATTAVTGNYVIEVYNGNDVLLESRSVGVEEFMPDRIKTTISIDKSTYQLMDKINATLEAVNYFGPPASNRNYEMELQVSRKSFQPKGYEDYNFYIASEQNLNTILRQGNTGTTGIVKETFELPAEYKDMGVLQGTLFTTVFDESGRPVNRSKTFDIFTQQVMYGTKLDDYYVSTGEPMKAYLVAVDKDGKPYRGAKALVNVVQYEWQSVLTKGYSNYYYTSKKVEKLVSTRMVNFTGGDATFSFIPPRSGNYEIRVMREGSNRYVSSSFYAYRWGTTTTASFDVNTEGSVDIVFDKEKYEVGEKAKVLFKTPFAGKLLVTLERNGINEYRVINTDKKSAEIEIPVKEEFLPNIYVSATLIKPLENSNIPLMVAHGFASLQVEKKSSILPVQITAVEKSRSTTKQKITVKTTPGAQVTLALVDEGILALKNFETPDPHGHFYAKRALEVNSYDLYPFLFPELTGRSSTGGDGYALEKRVNPLSNNRVKLVSFWSGILNTNSSGEATYEVDLPKFSGDLRIMAIAYKDKAFGSSSKSMKVADPLVVNTGLPRFFSPGDEIEMPVNISNTTAKNANTTVTVSVTGPVEVQATTQKVNVSANREGNTVFKLKALPTMGNAKIKVTVNGLNENFIDETDITVRPATSLLKTSSSGTLQAGQGKTLELNADFIPSSIETRLVVSKNPMAEFIDRFQYLVHYPHGCVEQTISAAFPQLYFAEFVKGAVNKKKIRLEGGESDLNPSYNVKEAIRKLQGMQLYNGAMSYWQGGYNESWWGSVYAGHFLIECKKAGYDVDNAVLDRLMEYINYRTNSKLVESYPFYQNGQFIDNRKYVAREIVYSLYVLSRAGKPNRPVMNYYKANQSFLTTDEKYMLAAAFALSSDKASSNEILPSSYIEYDLTKVTGGSFYSPIRNLAISLLTLVETDMSNPQVATLTKNLSSQLKNSYYLNTQELSFAFLALGKIAQEANKSNITATVSIGGKVVGNFDNTDLVLDNNVLNGQQVSINSQGNGMLYYFYEMEGLSSTGKYEEIDNFLRVRKEFFDRFGNKITGNSFKQNDLVVVRISIASLSNTRIENVVVTDMLPAGFEIENPRISDEREYEWAKNRAYYEHMDMRDDRINYFLTPSNREQYLYYTVRAVTKGKFVMGPVSADAMYNGEYRSYNGGGTVTVQ